MTRGNETDVPAAEVVEALHDTFAPSLYLYAWSLLGDPERYVEGARETDAAEPGSGGSGEDPVTDAVHEALVAGVGLQARLTDPADRGPWLYALVRSACQRRGFSLTCPYTRLATVPAEVPVARMFSRLPASHRELVELNLRHALSTSAVARVLGLDPRICGELSRSAIRRAAEGMEDLGEADAGSGSEADTATNTWRTQVQQVSSALALLRPPGPPPGLRARVVHTCTSPEAAGDRSRIAAAMQPLTADGYPVHRSRPPGAPVAETPQEGGTVETPLPRALPGDRLTTADHSLHEDVRAPLPSPDHDPLDEVTGPGRRRWPLPAVSGLATVAVAFGLWWWASSMGDPSTMIDAGPALPGQRPGLSEVEAASTASDGKPGTEQTGTSASGDSLQEDSEAAEPPGEEPGDPAEAPEDEGVSAGEERTSEGSNEQAPEQPGDEPLPPRAPGEGGGEPAPGEPEETPETDPGNGGSGGGGGSNGLLGGLLGLLFGNGQSDQGD
ncbi:sigma-70 family RNA polymerase sigma factor [Nocardiopsis metallicus]|uniref:DNA-directed RNA polymerase specialized sigma24 family protein n=1 Tax=Nocardiopsis metallicus TaxID=179819 RepID=A0A840WEX7_9ACTN|nr:sigma-70 family RNA polymerase sigma factor [Nocardiopsis metallicus]MBB5495539.1 DNA-directed RNA polymerase specialized sigma24 family protein [Nocardiopsis metallicus]